MYKFVIRQCALIKQNSLTVVRRRTGVTCDPIKLRNRVHSIVNTHYLTILRAKNNIRINKLRLTTEKNESARKALINGITQFRAIASRKQKEVAKARVSLKKAINICRKYGYFIKNIVRVKQYKFGGQNKRYVIRRYKLSLNNGLTKVKSLPRFKYIRKWRIVKTKDGKIRRYAHFVRVRVSGSKVVKTAKIVKKYGENTNISMKWRNGKKTGGFVKKSYNVSTGPSRYTIKMVRHFKTGGRKYTTKRVYKTKVTKKACAKRVCKAHGDRRYKFKNTFRVSRVGRKYRWFNTYRIKKQSQRPKSIIRRTRYIVRSKRASRKTKKVSIRVRRVRRRRYTVRSKRASRKTKKVTIRVRRVRRRRYTVRSKRVSRKTKKVTIRVRKPKAKVTIRVKKSTRRIVKPKAKVTIRVKKSTRRIVKPKAKIVVRVAQPKAKVAIRVRRPSATLRVRVATAKTTSAN